MRTTLALVALLALPAAQAQTAQHYRLDGVDSVRGGFAGSLLVESTAAGSEITFERSFSGAEAATVRGLASLNGSALVARVNGLELRFDPSTGQGTYVAGTVQGQFSGQALDWTRETQLDAQNPFGGLYTQIERYVLSAGREGTLRGVDGATLGYAVYRAQPERAAIVFSPGRTESYRKYAELIYDLRDSGYSLYFLDHRGQGTSERLLAGRDPVGSPDWQRGHVEDFEHYVRDLERFMDQVVRRDPHRAILAWGHSMGGAALTRYAQLHPQDFAALALCAPMHQIPLKWWEWIFVQGAVLVGQGQSYARGKGPYDPAQGSFASNETTHSPARYALKTAIVDADAALWTGGPTYRWVQQVNGGTARLRREAGRLTTPSLLLQAELDTLVVNAGQDQVAARAAACQKVVMAGASHEILFEVDPIRNPALTRILRFFDARTR